MAIRVKSVLFSVEMILDKNRFNVGPVLLGSYVVLSGIVV